MKVTLQIALSGALAFLAAAAAAKLPAAPELRSWIEGFKTAPRGPFERIRWFCKDGTVLPPKAYACKNHGGGIQHGEWNQRAKALREGGYTIANVLAELDVKDFVGPDADLFALEQILLERFLIGRDDGWIFRGARTYRGALQIEDEEAGSRRLVLAMLGDPAWRDRERFLLLRETVRLLPLQSDEGSAADVRKQALVLAEKDKAFTPLRAKIHNQPDAGDAAKVRGYAKKKGKANLAAEYERLAAGIDALYSGSGGSALALALAPKVGVPELSKALRELGARLQSEQDPATRLALAARLLGLLRKHFPQIRDPQIALEALQLSLALEIDAQVAGEELRAQLSPLSARQRVELLDQTAEALYGAGLLTAGDLGAVKKSRQRIESGDDARKQLGTLTQAPKWAERSLASHFAEAVEHLAPLEPEVHGFTRARLRSSPLHFYGGVTDSLAN